MNVYTHGPLSGKAPQSLVILLHGYGSNGQDLIGLAADWEEEMPDTVFVSPDAPFPCEVGFGGYQWFSLQSWAQMAMIGGADRAMGILDGFISEQMARFKLPASKVALVGFSQGTMMSLYVGPRCSKTLAGILGYSGALLGGEALVENNDIARAPICLIHGELDPVVPVAAWYHAKELLRQAKFDVTGYTTPGLVHSIDTRGIHVGCEFLKSVLYP